MTDIASRQDLPLARGLGRANEIRWPLRWSGELFDLQYGKALTEASRRPGNIPVYGSNGQTGTHDTALFKGPGVIIGRKGMGHLGVEWTAGEYWVIDTAYSLRPMVNIDLRFAYYLISHTGVDHLKHGTSNPSLTREAFAAQMFPVPPADEQKAIAEVLSALDDKIAANDRVITSAESLMIAQASTASSRTTVTELAKQRKATLSPGDFEAEVVHFSLPAFDEGKMPEISPGSSIKSNKTLITESCVLVSKLNPKIPRIWDVITLPGQMSLASTEFVALVPDRVPSSVMWATLSQPSVSVNLAANVAGTSGSHQRVKPAELLTLQVKDPRTLAPEVQRSIADLGATCYLRRTESFRLRATRDQLLPLLMSGKVRVREAEKVVEGVV